MLAAQPSLLLEPPDLPPRPRVAPEPISPEERAERLKNIRGVWRAKPADLEAERRRLLGKIPRDGVPVIDQALHEAVTTLQERERVLRANPAILAWQRGEKPALNALDFDQTLTFYVVLLLDHELDIIDLMDCWSVETRTNIYDVCDADGIFTKTLTELPLEERRLVRAVERRLRSAHLERLAADIKTAGFPCDESCGDLKGSERKECFQYCREDNEAAKEMARDVLAEARMELKEPVDRLTLLQTVMDYGMVFD
jgi:hypothetical protein